MEGWIERGKVNKKSKKKEIETERETDRQTERQPMSIATMVTW